MGKPAALKPSEAYLSAHAERAGKLKRRMTPAEAFRTARAMFDAGEQLDMVALAKHLNVSRGTLYRWAGDRERLLADLVWSLAEELFEQAKAAAPAGTGEQLAKGIKIFVHGLVKSEGLRAVIKNDTELAMRILTRRRDTGVQERAVNELVNIIRSAERRGEYKPRLNPELLAYSIVRVIEGFVYNDLSVGIEPQLNDLDKVIRTLL